MKELDICILKFMIRGRCKIEKSMEQRLRFYALKTENGLRRVRNPWYN